MKQKTWQKGLVAAMVAGLLATASVAQEGEATGEVQIEGEATTTTTAEPEKPRQMGLPVKPQITTRDPFVNTILSGEVMGGYVDRRPRTSPGPSVSAPTATVAAAAPATSPATAARAATAAEDEEEEIDVPAPEVTITGIVSSGSGRYAIVSAGPSSYIVGVGQKLADYRVSQITNSAVTFSFMGKSFEIEMEDEFGLR